MSTPVPADPGGPPRPARLSLAVALDGAGWHPAAWRSAHARPAELLTPRYWIDLLAEAQRGRLDFVTIDDTLGLQADSAFAGDERTDRVRGRLDAVLTAARIAPVSSGIGVIPTISTAHTEPFHISKAIATLDYVSTGRAGVQVRVSGFRGEDALFGRRTLPVLTPESLDDPTVTGPLRDLFDEAADYVEVVRRLWDSWSDDAEIRDVATGRFIDRDRLHYIDFAGRWFSVKGPSITPRPPQGQPLVTALAHSTVPYRLAARQADAVFVTPADDQHAGRILAELAALSSAAGRRQPLRVYADLLVFLDRTTEAAQRRKQQLDVLAGDPLSSDARIVTGTADELAEHILRLSDLGFDGVRLRPGELPYDLQWIVDDLVPLLQRRGRFPTRYEHSTLRANLGLERPANRYDSAREHVA